MLTSSGISAASRARRMAGVDCAGIDTTASHSSQTAARIPFTTPVPSSNGTSR
ncbi:DUF2470 domain-containing protein [Rhizobium sp.]|uniref:DUF2470 domain-containing protein n=1 Tax=Rhizobium sp. TaxID=391 RepID=UPI003917E0FE